ncbi:hypothetical protein [Lyngbya aestuarii]|uniref:hypothetical protein n=1 Tax=Lyngbya aestuarii TaxID=118322 RepID=UPI00403DC24B
MPWLGAIGESQTGALIDIFVDNTSSELDGPVEPVFAPDGNLYVSSLNTNTVLRYDGKTGSLIDQFIPPGTGGLDGAGWLAFQDDSTSVPESSAGLGVLVFATFLGTASILKCKLG